MSVDALAALLSGAERVVALTGAGVSTESGIPDFRSHASGLWQEHDPMRVASIDGFLDDPSAFYAFWGDRFGELAEKRPNATHALLAALEAEGRIDAVITQNIDGLHQAAGSVNVQELHGSIFEVVTRDHRPVRELDRAQLSRIAKRLERIRRGWLPIPRMLWAVRRWLGLGWRGLHLPNLVLFGDALCEPDWTRGLAAAEACDCLIQIGCSGVVLPAAMLPLAAKSNGARVIAIDPQPTEADIWLSGSAAQVTPQLVAAALSRQS